MRLKILTTTFFVLGILLLVAWPIVVGPRPEAGSSPEVWSRYGMRLLFYFAATSLTFLITATLAVLVIRQQRREYAEQAKRNLRDLIESTLKDHGRRS